MLFRADRDFTQLADDRRIALIIGVHGHSAIAEHGFRARGGDGDIVTLLAQHDIPVLVLFDIGIGLAAGERVFEVPHMAVDFDILDLEVGNRRLELGIPVHQPLAAIHQALIVELDEDLHHGGLHLVVLGVFLTHGETLARPVTGGTEAAQLGHDLPTAFLFPLPDALEESLPPHIPAGWFLPLGQLSLDHHLRGDACMVGTGLPEHAVAEHALIAGQHILQRIVERVADMQAARHIGRRNDDTERVGVRVVLRLEGPGFFPVRIDAGFGLCRIEGLVHHDTRISKGHQLSRRCP